MVDFIVPPPPKEEEGGSFKIPPPPELDDKVLENISPDGFVLPPSTKQIEENNERLTEAELKKNPEWIRAAKSIYEWNESRTFGFENEDKPKKLNSDEEYANYALRYMGWFNYNIPKMANEASDLRLYATQEQREDFVTLMDMYDNKKISWAGTGRFFAGIVADPVTYIGIGSFGVGLGAKVATKVGTKQGIRQFVRAGVIQGGKVSSVEGAAYAVADNAFRQSARIMSGQREDFDWGESAKAAAFGATIAALPGATIGGTAAYIKNKGNVVPSVTKEGGDFALPPKPEELKQTFVGPKIDKVEPVLETPAPRSNELPDVLIPPKDPRTDPKVKAKTVRSLLKNRIPKNDPYFEEIASALGYDRSNFPLVYTAKNAPTGPVGNVMSDVGQDLLEDLDANYNFFRGTGKGYAESSARGKPTELYRDDLYKALEQNDVLPEFEQPMINYVEALNKHEYFIDALRRAGINPNRLKGKTNKEVEDIVDEIVTFENVEGGKVSESFRNRFEEGPPVETYADDIANVRTIKDIAPDNKDFQTDTTVDLNDRLVEVGVKIMDDLEIPRNPNVRISDQLEEVLFQAEGNPVAREKLDSVLKNNNITLPQLSNLFRGSIADSARRMQKLSSVSKSIENLAAKIGKTAKPETWAAKLYNFIKQADNIRRGLLVSQIATAMRNNTAQLGRVTMKTLIDVFDNTLKQTFNPLRRAFGAKETPVNYARSFELILNLTKNKKQARDLTNLLTKYYVKDAENLFTRYSSDVADATKTSNASRVIKVGQKVTDGLNILNRMQEFWYRRAIFANTITDALLKKGIDIKKVGISDDLLKYVNKSDIEKAVDDALYFTYAKTPDVPIVKRLVDVINASPFLATGIIPFPRFMANAMAFQFRHSPLGFAGLLTPKEIAKLKAGNYQTLGQAVVGTTLLLTMVEAKRKGMAEDHKWYELETSSGKTIDMRPYFPLTPYLLVADMIVRAESGRGAPDAKDVLQGLTGAQFRAGASIQLVQNLLDGMSGLDTTEKVNKFMSEYTSNVLGGYLTPIRMFGDFVDQDQQFRRPVPTGEFTTDTINKLKSNIPFVRDQFPETQSPTREAAPGRPDTIQIPFTDINVPGQLTRQLTGATVREEKNAAEREFDRLGFKRRDILPYSGNAVVDQTRAEYLGPLIENIIPVIIKSEKYQSAPNEMKIVILRKTLTELRGAANDYIKENNINEEAFAKAAFNRQPKYIKNLLNSQNITAENYVEYYKSNVAQDRTDR